MKMTRFASSESVLILLNAIYLFIFVVVVFIFFTIVIQSTLVISKSKGSSKKLRDIRTSTYQMCSSEEKNNLNNQNLQRTM